VTQLWHPLLAAAVLFLVLIQPNHPQAMTWGALRLFPLELPVILTALVVLGRSWVGIVARVLLVAALSAIVLLKLADFGTFIAFNRGFNVVVDLMLAHAGWTLLKGSIGLPLALVAGLGALLAFGALVWALWWATGVWSVLVQARHWRGVAAVAFIPALALAVAEVGQVRRAWVLPDNLRAAIPGAAFTVRVGVERIEQVRDTRADLAAFRVAALDDPMLGAGPLLDHLGDRDLILIYVESYGRSSFRNPLYAPTHTATLQRIQRDLEAQGVAMRSGWATAPMTGGQSWLAHGSVASGLWLNTQGRYRAMLVSPRRTLFHFARAAGRRSVAIKPAHVFPWPEGAFFGFDAIYNAADLGYRGQPFNWVTMPDQFTLMALDRLERDRTDRAPIVAQVALVSSHAPWVPIPELVAWEDVGDGTIFDRWALSGDPPDVVWRDHDRVRDQFRLAVDYSLQAVGAWALRHADNPPLIIMLGDHEPAGFVAGTGGQDVPVHVIGPRDLVDRFAGMGWGDGMIPADGVRPRRMDQLRDDLLRALSTGAP
jgi:hypothetical protein